MLLDYGCGAGDVVKLAKAAGIDAYGVDLFYKGGDARTIVTENGLLGTRIFTLDNGVIPFGDEHFDCVTSNQVFEHIDDFRKPLEEIYRVLKPGGIFINLFPTVDVWREGHIGIPFVHWFTKTSRIRFAYAMAVRSMGMGYHKKIRSPKAWTENYLGWIDAWTHYKPFSAVRGLFEKYFIIDDFSHDYMLYRIEQNRYLSALSGILGARVFTPILRMLCHRLSGRVFLLRKPQS